jgi:hypothetical protein
MAVESSLPAVIHSPFPEPSTPVAPAIHAASDVIMGAW